MWTSKQQARTSEIFFERCRSRRLSFDLRLEDPEKLLGSRVALKEYR